jgi:GAF domain-containing protein/DNA-binding response OmpR family regulator
MTARAGRDRKSTKILHIEDNAENRMLVRALLEAEGYTLVEAEDGLSGIEAALREEPALILLDINLPGVDGYEVGVILRSFPGLAATPIVAVTAYAMEGDRERMLVAGCDGYIPKPIDADFFPLQVAEFLQGKRERVEERDATPYLRELNQRLVYRLVSQIEELKRLNQYFVKRAVQLEDLHVAVQDVTAEMGVEALLERLLGAVVRALGTKSLTVELIDPAISVTVRGDGPTPARRLLPRDDTPGSEVWAELQWSLPLVVQGRRLGVMRASHVLPTGAKADEEQLLKIVANQLAIAVENARLYASVDRRAAEATSLVEAGRLLASTLDLSEVLHRLAELTQRRLATDSVVRIWLRDVSQPGEFRLHAQAGKTAEPPPNRVHVGAGDGLVGTIIYQRSALVVDDLRTDPRVKNRDRVRREGLVSFLGVPLLLEDIAVGILTIATREARRFTGEDVRLVEALATSAAVAIWNARLYQETQQRLSQTETLLNVGRAISSTLEVTEVARRAARELVHALGADVGAAWRWEPGQKALVPLAGYRIPKSLIERVRSVPMTGDEHVLARLRGLDAPVYASDSTTDPAFDHPLLRLLDHKSALIAPMRVKSETLGGFVIVWTTHHHEFRNEELRLVDGIVRQAAIAIENGRLLEAERVARAAQAEEAEVSAALLRLAQAIVGSRDLDEVLRTVVGTTAQLMNVSQCGLFLLEPSDGTLVPAAIVGVPADRRSAYLGFGDGIRIPEVAKAIESQEPVIAQADRPGFGIPAALVQALDLRSVLILPLVSGGQLMGTMIAHTPGVRRTFSSKEIVLARGIAAHAAVAIDKARLFQQTEARLRETETLLAISQAVSSTLDASEAMRRVAREIARALGADTAAAYLADQARRALHPIAGYHVPADMRTRSAGLPIPISGHPFMEEAWTTRRPVWTDDAGRDARLDRASYERFPHQTLLFVPMTVKDEMIGGFFAVWWRERRQLTAPELRLVKGISDQAAMFMENARLYDEATRRRREAEELARLARTLTESLDVADVGERIVASAAPLMGGTFAMLRLLQPDGTLKLIAAKGDADTTHFLPAVIAPGWGTASQAVAAGAPVWTADVVADPRISFSPEIRSRIEASDARARLCVPLRFKRQIIGALTIGAATGRQFSEAEIALLQTFADQAAIALENSRLYSDLRAALRAVEESQQRQIQGERLRALGEMAGGVAHDFNNVLAIIVGRAEVLLNETQDPELQRQLNVIINVALDAAQTVKRIQEFTRMRRARPFQHVRIDQLLAEVVDVTRSRWKDDAQAKGITYDVQIDAVPTPPIAGDPSEIREALTNIVFNALDAMPEGGRVVLSTAVEGDRVVCRITDTGVGMTEEVRQRIFDPFFTTKGERGTGLGLSVVYGIIVRHNAEIDVQSQLESGTTFVLRFPVADAAPSEAPTRPTVRSTAKGRILIIDDEQDVGDIMGDFLGRDGHQVSVCRDAETGLAAFEKGAFDLVITDLGMPGMSGWEVARLVKLQRPGTPVAMVTGWGDRIDPAEATARGVDFIVPKPFKRDNVREIVALALAAAPSLRVASPRT